MSLSTIARFRSYALSAQPPPAGAVGRFLYGLAQPFFALRALAREPDLLRAGLTPALAVAGFCGALALLDTGWKDPARFAHHFYATFLALAPVPSILFARHYAKLAAAAHERLGFGARAPKLMGLSWSLKTSIKQAVLVALVVAPFKLLLEAVPGLGNQVWLLVSGLWVLHWVVVDAVNDGRTLRPGQTVEEAEEEERSAPRVWFVRALDHLAQRSAGALRRLIARFARACDRLSENTREDVGFVEENPEVAAGLAAGIAVMLGTPVLNVIFRPVAIVAAVHVLAQVEAVRAVSRALPSPQAAPAANL